MVTRNSLLLSRRAGLLTALGIGAGVLVHITDTILGVGVLIQQSIWLSVVPSRSDWQQILPIT